MWCGHRHVAASASLHQDALLQQFYKLYLGLMTLIKRRLWFVCLFNHLLPPLTEIVSQMERLTVIRKLNENHFPFIFKETPVITASATTTSFYQDPFYQCLLSNQNVWSELTVLYFRSILNVSLSIYTHHWNINKSTNWALAKEMH